MGDRSPVTRQIRDKNKDNKLYKLHKKLIYRRQNTVTVGDPARPLYEIWFQNLEPLCYDGNHTPCSAVSTKYRNTTV